MSLPTQITALLTSLTRSQLAAMPPAARQLLADQCRRVVILADAADREATAPQPPKSGILARLYDGERCP